MQRKYGPQINNDIFVALTELFTAIGERLFTLLTTVRCLVSNDFIVSAYR